jgi:hypothetical protein
MLQNYKYIICIAIFSEHLYFKIYCIGPFNDFKNSCGYLKRKGKRKPT